MKVSNVITGLQHIGIPTDRMEETITFYESLGFQIVHRTVNEASHSAVVFLEMKGLLIETWESREACKRVGAIDHVALDVDDIEKAFSTVKYLGYPLLDKEIRFLPFWEKGVRFFTIKGPNCEKIEFCQKL